MGTNSAAWLKNKFDALKVDLATYPVPGDKEVVVRNHAVAINPLDRLIQKMGGFLYGWLKLPAILGADLAGEVIEVGSKVTRFKVGDRVLALAVGQEKSRNRPSEGAFQTMTVVLEHLIAKIPDTMPFESAVVLPLGLSTAASGMFQKDMLALGYPHANPVPKGEIFLVWGGSTSVGSNAIQLAVQAGYTVIATASPKNFDYLRKLGASHVFDYNHKNVVRDIRKVLKRQELAGAIAIGANSAARCIDIVASSKGRKFVAIATFPINFDSIPERSGSLAVMSRVLPQMIPASISLGVKSVLSGVKTKYIWGSSLMDNEVSKVIFEDFLPHALETGAYIAAPAPRVVGHGLQVIQQGIDLLKTGVSAQKLVVTL
jgi:NADPH:quinone reductase-like Zn-dependent oxidoreductase